MVTPHMTDIVHEFKQAVAAKYTVSDMRLFGSNARGDATEASDIDIFLQVANLTKDMEQDVYNMAYDLELRYDCSRNTRIKSLPKACQYHLHQGPL